MLICILNGCPALNMNHLSLLHNDHDTIFGVMTHTKLNDTPFNTKLWHVNQPYLLNQGSTLLRWKPPPPVYRLPKRVFTKWRIFCKINNTFLTYSCINFLYTYLPPNFSIMLNRNSRSLAWTQTVHSFLCVNIKGHKDCWWLLKSKKRTQSQLLKFIGSLSLDSTWKKLRLRCFCLVPLYYTSSI